MWWKKPPQIGAWEPMTVCVCCKVWVWCVCETQRWSSGVRDNTQPLSRNVPPSMANYWQLYNSFLSVHSKMSRDIGFDLADIAVLWCWQVIVLRSANRRRVLKPCNRTVTPTGDDLLGEKAPSVALIKLLKIFVLCDFSLCLSAKLRTIVQDWSWHTFVKFSDLAGSIFHHVHQMQTVKNIYCRTSSVHENESPSKDFCWNLFLLLCRHQRQAVFFYESFWDWRWIFSGDWNES